MKLGDFMKQVILAIAVLMVWQQTAFAKTTLVSKDDYVVGGLVGSIVGFGIGHAVQSRYKSKGWIFTAGEGIGLLAAKGIPQAMIETTGHAKDYIKLAGWTLFLGFRLWQIVDLWVYTKPERNISAANQLLERSWQNGWWGAQQEVNAVQTLSLPIYSW
jgi:hypothetical protein